MKQLSTVKLKTKRLKLRCFTLGDAEKIYHNWGTDVEVNKYMSWKLHETIEDSKIQLEKIIENYARDDYYRWAIVLSDSDELIGSIWANFIDEPACVNIAFLLSKKFWGQGYTTEAFREILKFFFEEIGVNRVEAMYHPDNIGSGNVLKKCGMKYEGRYRQAFSTNYESFSDMIMCSILAEEYFEK